MENLTFDKETQIIIITKSFLDSVTPDNFSDYLLKNKSDKLSLNYIFLLYYRYYYIYNKLIFSSNIDFLNNFNKIYDNFIKKYYSYYENTYICTFYESYLDTCLHYYKSHINNNKIYKEKNKNIISTNIKDIIKILYSKDNEYFEKYLLILNNLIYCINLLQINISNNESLIYFTNIFLK
jgi:hypothetical protein